MSACHFCGTSLDPKMRIVRDAECPSCGRDLHACVQCRHFDRNAHNMCREPGRMGHGPRAAKLLRVFFPQSSGQRGRGKGSRVHRALQAGSAVQNQGA